MTTVFESRLFPLHRGLTPRSSGAPTASHQARRPGWHIFRPSGLASRCRRPLSSNVRQHNRDSVRSTFLAILLAASVPFAQSQSTPSASKDAHVNQTAKGEFVVKLQPLGLEGVPEDKKLGRMSINKSISGDLVATTVGQMLSAMTDVKGSAGYVAIEKVDGVLRGKKGTFVLQHSGTMNKGSPSLSVTVVPDSGTGELVGIAGEFNIIISDGKHSYEFKYTLP